VRSNTRSNNTRSRTYLWLILLGVCLLSIISYTVVLACGWGNNNTPQSNGFASGCGPWSWMRQSQTCSSPTSTSNGPTRCPRMRAQGQNCVSPTVTGQPCTEATNGGTPCVQPTATQPISCGGTLPQSQICVVPTTTGPGSCNPTQSQICIAPTQPVSGTPPVVATSTSTTSSSYTLTVDNSSNIISSSIVSQLQSVFQYSYPKLVQRFGSSSSPKSVTLTVNASIAGGSGGGIIVAETSGSHITLNGGYQNQAPNDLGWLTHELTHVVQGYTGNAPGWFTEGMADYGRYYYAPPGANPSSWNILTPPKSSDNYTDGYGVAARFLIWLQEQKSSTIVDQLNKTIQNHQDFNTTFQQLTGGTVDQLWAQYKANPALSQ
jgi:hypothetical protein